MIENIKEEADRCLGCLNKPCKAMCPLENDITEVIKLFKEEKYHDAYDILCKTTVLQPICGRICPHEKQCKSNCTRKYKSDAIEIGNIESYLGDLAIENNWEIPKFDDTLKNKKIAVVGGGPSGLTCAAFLSRYGANVTIFEKQEKLGGILTYGIPYFRLDKLLIEKQIQKILKLGIKVKTNFKLELEEILGNLRNTYDAVYLAFGANVSKKMNIPGENLENVYGGNEIFEKNLNIYYNGKDVFVSGGGNVAMDVARTAKKRGAKSVTVVYRRSEAEMPAERAEILAAKNEGIGFLFHTNIIKILGDTEVSGIECVKTEYIDSVLTNVEKSNFTKAGDLVIMAIGSKTDINVLNNLNIKLDNKNNVLVDEYNMTSLEGVFAGGDLTGGIATVAYAARSGRDTAENIRKYLINV